nr:SDR family NAD(P)-dependent oxidoreductase [Bacteroidota bacterium]
LQGIRLFSVTKGNIQAEMDCYFITGTSTGLGKALATLLLEEEDTRVFGFGRHCTIKNARYRHEKIDLADTAGLENFSFANYPVRDAGKVVLINNAGIIQPVQYLGEAEPADLIRNFNVNLIAPAVLANAFIKSYEGMEAEKWIINISSGAAQSPIDGWSSYCSSKAGLDMLSRTAALEREKRKDGFCIVSIAPGIVDTPMQEYIRNTDSEQFSRVDQFRGYKKNNDLAAPETAARKILQAIKNKSAIKDVVFSVK